MLAACFSVVPHYDGPTAYNTSVVQTLGNFINIGFLLVGSNQLAGVFFFLEFLFHSLGYILLLRDVLRVELVTIYSP